MAKYLIRTRTKPYEFWKARHSGLTVTAIYAYRYNRAQIQDIISDYSPGWFKSCMVLIPVEDKQ